MNHLLTLIVVVVALLIVWLRFRKNVPNDPDNWWFTIWKPKKTDPNTPWYNLLRLIEGEDTTTTTPAPTTAPNPVFVQWLSSDATSILGSEDTAISTTNAAPDVVAWKAQRTNDNDRFVVWGGGVATFNPVLVWLVKTGVTPTIIVNNRRVVRLPPGMYLILKKIGRAHV